MFEINESSEALVSKIMIPARPESLLSVSAEANNEYPNVNIIAKAISNDVSLSAAVLQIVNSPAFAIRHKITNILQAVTLLGVSRVERIVTVVAMRESVGGNLNLARFWDSASEIANICSQLAPRLSGINQDDAYTLGLFHDCGIPLMMQAFDDYKQTLIEINKTEVRPTTKIEQARYQVCHTQVGYLLLEKWFLPQHISQAVYCHHHNYADLVEQKKIDDSSLSLLALLKMSDDISSTYRKSWRRDDTDEWLQVQDLVLSYIGIDEAYYNELKADIIEKFDM